MKPAMLRSSGATPAYRGYRLQALYTLWKILNRQQQDWIYQPEGLEDLAVYVDDSDTPSEIIQIKAYSSPLNLSDFDPTSPHSFFRRVSHYMESDPRPVIQLVSFGEIGPELSDALGGVPDSRKRLIKKLAGYGFSENEAEDILEAIELIHIDEQELTARITLLLQEVLTGVSPEAAFALMNFWLYLCAEDKCRISYADVTSKITEIGRFLSECHAHHQEWFTTIKPFELEENIRLSNLADEFYEGISARFDHIIAGVDARRDEKMDAIENAFENCNVVIIHGASGQGKSTLAYRYVHDFYPQNWRFQVRGIEGKRHAFSIATALIGHINAVNLPTIVYLDVSPSEPHWTEVVRELASHELVRVLVTIREEDFRRASISRDEFQYDTLELTFDEQEARSIYSSLQLVRPSTNFLNFEDTWSSFGGQGPLLEFVYLVTQGQSLRAKLERQINRLRDDVRLQQMMSDELHLLRLVSVASAYEARLKISSLITTLDLPDHERTFELLEKEYLLWRDTSEGLICGIHPIRSQIIAELLSSAWDQNAIACLPHIFEPDYETFLLHLFLRRHNHEVDTLIKAIKSQTFNSWLAISGVMNALIWLGLKHYADENSELLQQSYQHLGSWMYAIDIDIADAMPGVADDVFENMKSFFPEAAIQTIQEYRSRQTHKRSVFLLVQDWLQSAEFNLDKPQDVGEWLAVASCSLKIGHFGLATNLSELALSLISDQQVFDLPVTVLADLIFGLYSINEPAISCVLADNYETLTSKFIEETGALNVSDDGETITVHFWVEGTKQRVEQDHINGEKQKNLALRHLAILRRLFPDREVYASQGYGHDIFAWKLPFDETQKAIPRRTFVDDQLSEINATFRGIAEFPLRKATWRDYAEEILDQRLETLNQLQKLEKALVTFFRKTRAYNVAKSISESEWREFGLKLGKPVLLPTCAVDHWGFSDEFLSNKDDGNRVIRYPLALTLIKPLHKSIQVYQNNLSDFFNQSRHVMAVSPALGRTDAEHEDVWRVANQHNFSERFVRLSVINLYSALKILPTMQQTFREYLGDILDESKLQTLHYLEQREVEILNRIADLWLLFAMRPRFKSQNPQAESQQWTLRRLKGIKKHLKRIWKQLKQDGIEVEIISENTLWDANSALWIAIDSQDLIEGHNAVETVMRSIQEAVQKVGDRDTTELILERYWNHFLIVVLKQGSVAYNHAWHMHWVDCYQDLNKLSPWAAIPREIPSSARENLGLVYLEGKHADLGRSLPQYVTGLSLLVSQFKQVLALPDLDDTGLANLQEYISALSVSISENLQGALDTMVEMEHVFEDIPGEDLEQHPNIVQAMHGIQELRNLITPDGHVDGISRLTPEQSAVWAEQLAKARDIAFVTSLYWLSDVIHIHSSPV